MRSSQSSNEQTEEEGKCNMKWIIRQRTYDLLEDFLTRLYNLDDELASELEYILVQGNITPEGMMDG